MTRCRILAALLASTFLAEAQVPPPAQGLNSSENINWPIGYEPSKSKFYVHNTIEINASPEKVWSILTDALKWPLWYKGAKNLSYVTHSDTVLQVNSIFKWQTMGLKLESTIKQYDIHRLLAWESKNKSIKGFHVWLIVPTQKGCKIITDESQNGWLTFFENIFQRQKLKKRHDNWLLELKKKAELKT